MFKIEPTYSFCGKNIEAYEEVYVKMCYPKSRGFTELKAFFQNEGKIICKDCFEGRQNNN